MQVKKYFLYLFGVLGLFALVHVILFSLSRTNKRVQSRRRPWAKKWAKPEWKWKYNHPKVEKADQLPEVQRNANAEKEVTDHRASQDTDLEQGQFDHRDSKPTLKSSKYIDTAVRHGLLNADRVMISHQSDSMDEEQKLCLDLVAKAVVDFSWVCNVNVPLVFDPEWIVNR